MPIRLSYPITRNFGWHVEPFVYPLVLIVVGVLIPLNFALNGYQLVTVTENDYDYDPSLWFYKFGRKPKEPICDSFRLTVGDSFSTKIGALSWTLTNVIPPSGDTKGATYSYLNYYGTDLSVCDVIYLSAVADSRTASGVLTAEVQCNGQGPNPTPFVMTTSTTVGYTFTGTVGNSALASQDLNWDASELMLHAIRDMLYNLGNTTTYAAEGDPTPAYFAIGTGDDALFCPRTGTSDAQSSCTATPPQFAPGVPLFIQSDGVQYSTSDQSTLSTTFAPAYENALQLMLALARIDIGYGLSNNFIVDPSLINQVIAESLTVDGAPGGSIPSELYTTLTTKAPPPPNIPEDAQDDDLSLTQSTELDVQYVCHFQQAKSPGTIVVATAVATITLAKTGYSALMFILIWWTKRSKPDANECEHHTSDSDLEGQPTSKLDSEKV